MADQSKILIVEDDLSLAEMYKTILEEELFQVILAADGEEALVKVRAERPDLVLLDIILPKKDGSEVLLDIKNDPSINDIPVIVFSNLEGPIKDAKDAQAYGADDLIVKASTRPEEVVAAVKKVLSAKRTIV